MLKKSESEKRGYYEYTRVIEGKKNGFFTEKRASRIGRRDNKLVTETTELVPDAFNMHSQRVVLVLGEQQDKLWDKIYDVFEGKVPREK